MILEKFNPVIPSEDDGFAIEATTSWTFRRNQLIRHYLHVFTVTMERKFDYLVYLDLYAGSGLKRLENGEIISGSPVIALSEPRHFSKYIFCEINKDYSDALKVRVNKYCRQENILVFNGDPNHLIERLAYYIPDSTKKNKVATLCLIDPFSMNIDFETVRILSELDVNFLVVLALPWNSKDSFHFCIDEERELLNAFLGKPWSNYESGMPVSNNEMFFRNLVKYYHQNLRELGYMAKGSFHKMEDTNYDIPFFFCGYYSNTTGTSKIHSEVLKRMSPQVKLFE